MIPVNTHPALVRLSRSSINIIKRSNQRTVLGASSSSSNAVYQKRTFISIVNPDAPTIVKIRKSAAPKIAETVETEKVLSLRRFLGNPKPTEKTETNTAYNVDSVAKTFTEAIQMSPDTSESPETQTINKPNVVPKTETSRKEGREETKCVEKDDIGLKTDEALNQNQEGVIVEKEVKVAEEKHREAAKLETSIPVSQEEEDVDSDKSDDESDSSSDSDSSTSSSSSDSESDLDVVNRDDLARKRLDQVNTINYFRYNLFTEKCSRLLLSFLLQNSI